ncbi:cas scaffolding protein family member 4-like [Gouania willdenowi]|uniref:cas scaffolding protein family member 4-like n=1 Tax=Gouania willdenowi TaxID=441366 RepID=UPI00105445F2|nr:cas scaffolding protein family member 4-like [Gouania willdenowi]
MNKLAKAIYDNTADSEDELAFRKGDIVTVTDQEVVGSSGWWMCSLYGRRGLAPANRLKLLTQSGLRTTPSVSAQKPKEAPQKAVEWVQNIYQTPCVLRPISCSGSQQRGVVYTVPSMPTPAVRSPVSPEGTKPPSILKPVPGPKGELYDIPSQSRRASLYAESTTPRWLSRKTSLVPISELENSFTAAERRRRFCPQETLVYSVPSPPLAPDPNYDFPVPSDAESQQKKKADGYRTLPNPRKPQWIYDVPLGPDKPSPSHGFGSNALHEDDVTASLYDTLPKRVLPVKENIPSSSLYDTPKPSSPENQRVPVDVPTTENPIPGAVSAVSAVSIGHKLLECWGKSRDTCALSKHTRMRLTSASFREPSGRCESVQEDERGKVSNQSKAGGQSISSSSSTCDSLALSSSSPEPMHEVTLSLEETCRKLVHFQDSVCGAVPHLMDYVSSNWRCREHLEKHLEEIKESAKEVTRSLTCFLQFALNVKGNARRLTDGNLQARLYKQFSVVENSGLILQQTVVNLNTAGWPLHTLSQDPGQAQSPDQLERFVMVARTVPEDVKRLVSIINANARLLFRTQQKDLDSVESTSLEEMKKNHQEAEQEEESVEDNNDYVELQNKDEEKHRKETQEECKETVNLENHPIPTETKECEGAEEYGLSEHCRLYFGALQKAIRAFVSSLQGDQPPEKFISQSKLVIMVGQRLVETLCRRRSGSNQSLLYRSSHLCALLKQLAVSTKKAALRFPDQQALHEAVEFAKELSQKAQHFRLSLEI